MEWKKQVSSHQHFIDCARKNGLVNSEPFRRTAVRNYVARAGQRVMFSGIFMGPDYILSAIEYQSISDLREH